MEKELVKALRTLLASYTSDFKQITGSDLNNTEAVKLAKQTLEKYENRI